jgi:hypothetical protein
MLIYCDEAWRENQHGKKVGTLAAVAIPRTEYNGLSDRLFLAAQKYFGFENARTREIKGKILLNPYEFRREANDEQISMKLSFAREVLEELRSRSIRVFASVVYRRDQVDLLCEDPELLDRPYLYLMERIHEYMRELGAGRIATFTFDDRGLKQNARVAEAYRNFLSRSRIGRSFHTLLRSPFFAYSSISLGLQAADLVCTVVNRYHTIRRVSHRIPELFGIVREMEWVAANPTQDGHRLRGIKVLADIARRQRRNNKRVGSPEGEEGSGSPRSDPEPVSTPFRRESSPSNATHWFGAAIWGLLSDMAGRQAVSAPHQFARGIVRCRWGRRRASHLDTPLSRIFGPRTTCS